MADVPHHSGEEMLRFLTFRTADRLYALPADAVAEVIRLPVTARVPHAPYALLGLANLRGGVVPVASLPRLLGGEQSETGASARALVLCGAHPMALAVDAVETVIAIEAEAVNEDQAALAAEPGEALLALVRAGGDATAKVLDLQTLLTAAFVSPARPAATGAPTPAAFKSEEAAEASGEERTKLVVFEVAQQAFALELGAVREIIAAPAHVAKALKADALVLGVSDHRSTLLPLFSMRGLLGFGDCAAETQKVVVMTVRGAPVGLVVDRLRTITAAAPDDIEPTPMALSARIGGEAKVKAMLRGEDGTLISILSPQTLFSEDVMQRLAQTADAATQIAADQAAEISLVVFRLDGDEYALPIEVVDEVAPVPAEITRLPKTPAFLEGVVNLRGEVLPVIDQRRRFDLPPLTARESRRLVIVRTATRRAALIVDSVVEVLRRPADTVRPPPDMTGEAGRLVSGVVNLEAAGRMVLALDPDALLSQTEQALLDSFVAEGAPGAA